MCKYCIKDGCNCSKDRCSIDPHSFVICDDCDDVLHKQSKYILTAMKFDNPHVADLINSLDRMVKFHNDMKIVNNSIDLCVKIIGTYIALKGVKHDGSEYRKLKYNLIVDRKKYKEVLQDARKNISDFQFDSDKIYLYRVQAEQELKTILDIESIIEKREAAGEDK